MNRIEINVITGERKVVLLTEAEIAEAQARATELYPQEHNAPILAQIAAFEATQHRAMREHVLGDLLAIERIKTINDEIANLRGQLVK